VCPTLEIEEKLVGVGMVLGVAVRFIEFDEGGY